MKATRNICPVCSLDTKILQEEDNLQEYFETLTNTKCPSCKGIETPEDKLLNAIYGKKSKSTG